MGPDPLFVFGTRGEHANSTQRMHIFLTCSFLSPPCTPGLMSEGIYRKSGVNSRVEAMYEAFRRDARSVHLKEGADQPDDVSNTLKRFFRKSEEGLLTLQAASAWLANPGRFLKRRDAPRSLENGGVIQKEIIGVARIVYCSKEDFCLLKVYFWSSKLS